MNKKNCRLRIADCGLNGNNRKNRRGAHATNSSIIAVATVALAIVLLTWAGTIVAQPAAPVEVTSAPTTEPTTAAATSQMATSAATTEPTTEPTTASAPATTEPTTTSAPAVTPRTTVKPVKPGEPISVNFKDVPLRTVLQYLSEVAGLIVVESAKPEGRVTVMSAQPVSVEQAISLLDTVLKEKGYAAIRTDAKTLKIVTLAQAKQELIPIRVGNDFTKIQPSDRIITQIIPLVNVDAVKLKADINSLIPTSADVTTNANSNTIIVTGTESTVRRIVEIVHGIDDRKTDASTVKVFQLKYANASNAARLITDIFKQDTSTSGGGGMGGFGGRGGGGFVIQGMPGTDTSTAGVKSAKVMASADDRTNTLVVSASPEVMKVIEGIITELDSNPSENQSVFVYHLKNAQATNVESVVNSIFGFSSSGTSSGGGTASNRGSTNSNTSRGISGGRTSSGGTSGGSTGSSNRGLSGNTGTTAGRTGGNTGTTANRGTAANRSGTSGSTSDLAGQVYVVADAATNSLLVTTASKNFERVRAIINDLDRAVPQVLIKVLIAEVTHDDSMNLGVEFSGMNLYSSGATEIKAGTNYNLLKPDSTGFIFSLDEKYVTAAIHALANTTKIDVLSRPYILTSDNQEAQIMVGQSVPYITSSFINSDTGSTTNTILYQDIGIILVVTPHINPQGLVTLDVYPEISSISDSTVETSPGVNATVFNKRFAQSRVAIRDGQTIVIGGLMEDRLTKSIDKVPFLGDIPGLGLLFQHTVEKKTKTELLIFLTPHVALDPDQLKGMSEDEKAGTKAIQSAVEPGAYKEHLRGMERGAATQPAYGGVEMDRVVEIPPDATTEPTTGESNGAKNRKELPYPNP